MRPRYYLRSTILLILIVCSVSTHVPNALAGEERKPSCKAWSECKWTDYSDQSLGVRLFFQDCTKPNAHYVLSSKANVLEQHRPSDDRTFNGPVVLEIYPKKTDETIEHSIQRQFVDKLTKIERENCSIEPCEKKKARSEVQRFCIRPKAAYEKRVTADFMKANPEGGIPYDTLCGGHGKWAEGEAYFEYHAHESKTKFAWIVIGQDEPLFDPESILFFDGTAAREK